MRVFRRFGEVLLSDDIDGFMKLVGDEFRVWRIGVDCTSQRDRQESAPLIAAAVGPIFSGIGDQCL